jgi:hypothetical protein
VGRASSPVRLPKTAWKLAKLQGSDLRAGCSKEKKNVEKVCCKCGVFAKLSKISAK